MLKQAGGNEGKGIKTAYYTSLEYCLVNVYKIWGDCRKVRKKTERKKKKKVYFMFAMKKIRAKFEDANGDTSEGLQHGSHDDK